MKKIFFQLIFQKNENISASISKSNSWYLWSITYNILRLTLVCHIDLSKEMLSWMMLVKSVINEIVKYILKVISWSFRHDHNFFSKHSVFTLYDIFFVEFRLTLSFQFILCDSMIQTHSQDIIIHIATKKIFVLQISKPKLTR